MLAREADRARHALTLNHLQDPDHRDDSLQRWCAAEFPAEEQWAWFELSAAASGQLAIFALLALAAESELSEPEVSATFDVYWPLLPLIATMLDSFVDQPEDVASGDHLYVSHYANPEESISRMCELIDRAARELATLPNGHRHVVVMTCMTTFYLSKDTARTIEMREQKAQLIQAGGSLARLLAPMLRTWRFAYSQSAA